MLGFVTGEELFHRFPHFREGELSKVRAHLVSEKHLICVAQQLDLGKYLHLGRGEEKSGGRNKTTLLVDALEAILAAIYLDGGIDPVRRTILKFILEPELEHLSRSGKTTAGQRLQIHIARATSGHWPPATVLCAGWGTRSGTQKTIYRRSSSPLI